MINYNTFTFFVLQQFPQFSFVLLHNFDYLIIILEYGKNMNPQGSKTFDR